MRIAGWWMAAALATVVATASRGETATVTLGEKVHVWDGTAKGVTVATEPSGLAVKVTYDGEEAMPSAAGVHAVVAEVAEDGYEGRAEGTLVIVAPGEYLVVDLSGGTGTERFSVATMAGPPAGGWGDEFKTDKLVLRWIEPGTFTMGSPTNELGRNWNWVGNWFPGHEPAYFDEGEAEPHEVTISAGYWMGVFEVTRRQWELVTGCPQSDGNPRGAAHADPDDIRGGTNSIPRAEGERVGGGSFLRILRAKTGLTFELPTEAQWEHACRAGTTTALNSGWDLTRTDVCPHMDEVGWYAGNVVNPSSWTQAECGHFLPNAWGLYDMHGNVAEWCLDIAKGGCSSWDAAGCRSAWRDGRFAFFSDDGGWIKITLEDVQGFRLACGAERSFVFENIGTHEWTERLPMATFVSTGTGGSAGEVEFEVLSGVGRLANGVLSFTGPGTTEVVATLEGWGSVTQTVTATKATAAVSVASRMCLESGTNETAAVSTTPTDVPKKVTYNGSTNAPSAPGAYAVRATVEDALYSGSGEGTLIIVGKGEYLAVDLSGGPTAEHYGVRFLEGPPEGGWGEEYKTTQLLLRKMGAGTFRMGAPYGEMGPTNETPHNVTLANAHWCGVFEVTQKQWELVMGSHPAEWAGDTRPVERVSYADIRGGNEGTNWPSANWTDAESFLGVLRAKTGLTFDLPTEAQWEFDCRAGTDSALNNGWDITTITNVSTAASTAGTMSIVNAPDCPRMAETGRFRHNQDDGKGRSTNAHAVAGSYFPNAWGLYDMHGNVAEWCLDGCRLTWGLPEGLGSSPAFDPAGTGETNRIVRGGDWTSVAADCRSARRIAREAQTASADTGFRLSCAAGRSVSFEGIGERAWNESVALRASTGTDGLGGEMRFAVASGPGMLKDGVLSFAEPGEVVVTATLAADGNGGEVAVAQTVAVARVKAQLEISGLVHECDGLPKGVRVAADPSGMDIEVTYDGKAELPTAPGAYAVHVEAKDDRLYEASLDATMVIVKPGRYMVVDLSGGPGAPRFPAKTLDAAPEGGWGEEHKTEKLVLRWVEPGTFGMGAPWQETGRPERYVYDFYDGDTGIFIQEFYPHNEPLHEVTLTEGYWIGLFETTQRQWELVMGNPTADAQDAALPVQGASYAQIRGAAQGARWPATNSVDEDSFMGVLRKKTGLALDLPTEAQWEMACRAGTTNALNSGRELTDTNVCPHVAELAQYAGSPRAGSTVPVGSSTPNAWGLYDTHGNVAEWCLDWDWYPGSYESDWREADARDEANSLSQTNPPGASSGWCRVVKGGAWTVPAWGCRSSARDSGLPKSTHFAAWGVNVSPGFRVACGAGELPEEPYTEGSPVPVEKAWLDRYAEAMAAAGGDYEAAALADFDGDGAAAWEEYVAGTSPEEKGDVFRVTGWTWEGGEMVPEYGPKDEDTRTYTVEAADGAEGTYRPTSEAGAAEGRRFYRVRVEMK